SQDRSRSWQPQAHSDRMGPWLQMGGGSAMKLASTTLAQRLTLVFVLLLLACSAATVWLQMRVSDQREQEVVQRLSQDLAARIARYPELMRADGLNAGASRELFGKLMQVNPSVE